jgi:hypothetical protein
MQTAKAAFGADRAVRETAPGDLKKPDLGS